MRKQPVVAGSPTGISTFLSVSPIEEDHRCLRAIIGHSDWIAFKADGVLPALACLQRSEISVVLCEQDLLPGTWIDILEEMKHLTNPPCLIVTSRLADERLWAQALNLGAWDVLAKPFDRSEVLQSLKAAWSHWYRQIQMSAPSMKMMKAAS